jgi:nucleoside-diphosphate-sugar epimerase
MKLLVVGAGGRLGAALAREFKEYDVTGFNHARLDLSNLTMTGAARFDFSLAHRELQWKPLHTPREGIAVTIDWYLNNRVW